MQVAKKKLVSKGHGLLPEGETRSEPFLEVAVNLIGPWKISVRVRPFEINALTAIDAVTNLVELTEFSFNLACTVKILYGFYSTLSNQK